MSQKQSRDEIEASYLRTSTNLQKEYTDLIKAVRQKISAAIAEADRVRAIEKAEADRKHAGTVHKIMVDGNQSIKDYEEELALTMATLKESHEKTIRANS